jgi:DNA-binding MarR family transcriptional regulator
MSSIDDVRQAPREAPGTLNFSLAEDRLAHLIRNARRGLARALQAGLLEHNVAFGHWTFLRILWIRDDINQRRLSALAGVMEPTTFAALQAMEKLGYIVRRQRPGNRKNIYVYLTDEGRSLRDKLAPIAIEINGRSTRGVSEADIAATRRTLLAIIGNLSDFGADAASAGCGAKAVEKPVSANKPRLVGGLV